MKAKYLLLSAVVAFAATTIGCQPESITGNNANTVTLESSYYQMPAKDGSITIKFTANDAWEILEEISYSYKDDAGKTKTVDTLMAPTGVEQTIRGTKVKTWLAGSTTSGSEGEQSLSFTAPDSENYKSVTLHLNCGEETQYIVVSQNESVIAPATCAEVIKGTDGKVYMVTGICTSIDNTQYGNWYLNDGTGEIYVYGTVNDKGEYDWANLNIAVGDEVTVKGPRKDHSGTIELIDVSVVSVKKALLSIDNDNFSVGSAADTLTIKAVAKGDFTFDNDASWASVASVKPGEKDTTIVSIIVAENVSPEGRTAHVKFASASGKDVTELTVTIVQSGQKGQTPENPFSVAEAIKAIKDGTAGAGNVYVKGIISQIDDISAQNGNAQYWISDDGTTEVQMEVFRGLNFGSAKFVEGDVLGLGWEVVVCGVIKEFKGTYELDAKNYIYSIEGATAAMTASDAIAYIDSPEFVEGQKIIVSGIINTVKIDLKYGNAEVWISDDGSEKAFELYRNNYFAKANYTAEDQLKVGDTITAVGVAKKQNSTYELDSKNFVLVHNGKTAVEAE